MTSPHAPRRLAALLVVGLALTSLTACSGIPFLSSGDSSSPTSSSAAPADERPGTTEDQAGDEGQTTEEACALVQDTIEEATSEFENVSAEDPTAVVEAMKAAAGSIAQASSEVTNDEVAALLPSLQDLFQQVGDAMSAIAEGDVTKLAEMEELGTGFQETSEKFQELCAP